MSEIGSTHFFPKTITATGAYAISAQGRQLNSTIKANGGVRFVSMGATTLNGSNDQSRRFRGVEIAVASDAADGATGTIRVYRAMNNSSPDDTTKLGADWDLQLIGTLSYTIGTQVGLGGDTGGLESVVPSGYRIADTMTWADANTLSSPKGIAEYIAAGFSGGVVPVAYSPADNTTALCLIPDVGNGDLYFDVNATNGAFVTILVRKLT